MERQLDVICVGGAVVDIPLRPVDKNIFDIESYPLDCIRMTVGGDAINEAIIISRLGHCCALMSLVGDDPAGLYIINCCKQEGVDTKSLNVKANVDTSINIGLVAADGERTFVTNRNGSLWKTSIDDIDLDRFGDAKILSLASIFNNPLLDGKSLVKIFSKAKESNLIICADMIMPRLGEKLEDIQQALGYVDYFFPNYDEACLLTGETDLEKIADRLLACNVKNVIIKTGKEGCFIKTNKQEVHRVPAIKDITALDTIGAGDNFASGFISALLEGKDLEACARFANATAAISVQSAGATAGVQSREQVEAILK